jgi:Domain of unknown function (DUF4400)
MAANSPHQTQNRVSAFLLLLIIPLMIPLVFSESELYAELLEETRINQSFWGTDRSNQLFEQAVRLKVNVASLFSASAAKAPVPPPTQPNPIADALKRSIEQSTANTSGLKSIWESTKALGMIIAYRVSLVLAYMPIIFLTFMLCGTDGLLVRQARHFEHFGDNPIAYKIALSALLMSVFFSFSLFLAPVALHPLFFLVFPVGVAFAVRALFTSFHRMA